MIIGIEGTGSQSWQNGDMTRSFVRRVLERTSIRPRYYFIGPSNDGLDGDNIIKGACQLVMRSSDPITLVGYSRGAAYCMEVCARLLRWHWRPDPTVETLVMFDAVSRQGDIDLPEKIPANVRRCFHAYRDPRAGSRYWFQNVGLAVENPHNTKMEKAMFHGSHGAMGGTFYDAKNEEAHDLDGNAVIGSDDRNKVNVPRTAQTSLAEDFHASNMVGKWMWPRLAGCGVLPSNADSSAYAMPFGGSRVPGQPNQLP